MERTIAELYKTMEQELDIDNAMNIVEWLTVNTSHRVSGMGQDRKAAEYIVNKLSNYGCDETKILEYETYNSRPGTSELTLLEPEHRTLRSLPACHIEATPPEGAEYEVVYVASGAEEEYIGKDVKGKAVLVEVSYAPATPEKAVIAGKMGAAVMICMNWGPKEEEVICYRGLKGVWGNPTPESYKKIPRIVGCGITRVDGEYLRDLCLAGEKVKIHLKVTAERLWETLPQPIGIIRGSEEPEKFLMVSAHLEGWEPGATDNATGIANSIDIARVLAKHKDELKRSVYFTYWNGHEIAEATGSTWFADYFWDTVDENCIGYINIDSTGMAGTEVYRISASRELGEFASEAAKMALDVDAKPTPLGKIGDQSFFGMGVPSIFAQMGFTDEVIEYNHGAFLGWWNHTIEDGMDKVSKEALDKDNKAELAAILGFINSDILPYNFRETAKDINLKVNNLMNAAEGVIDLSLLKKASDSFILNVERLNEYISSQKDATTLDQCKAINHTLLRLSRTLTGPFYSATDKYSQDSYGLSVLTKPIPLLYPIYEMSNMDKTNLEYRLQYTQMLRNRNMLTDALKNANRLIENLLG